VPTWTNRPPAYARSSAMEIIRTPPSRPLIATILSDDLVGTPTHFTNNRTTPCSKPDQCEFCDRGLPWRWHGYLAVRVADRPRPCLIELTAQAAESVAAARAEFGTLRGARIKLTRAGKRANGRVQVALAPPADDADSLPPEPDVPHALCHIWNYDPARTAPAPRHPSGARQIHVTNDPDTPN